MILAPLRGVTIRCFRETFRAEIAAAGFTEAVTPFICATPGLDPLKDRELRGGAPASGFALVPQLIGKDPAAFAAALERLANAGFRQVDLNCGCPFPMVRNKGRGCGLLRTPEKLFKMLEAGCAILGDGMLSIKTRLGNDDPGELLALIPELNGFPLRRIAVHARIARQMYSGSPDLEAFGAVAAASRAPVVYNGDATPGMAPPRGAAGIMVGRAFVRALGERADAAELLRRYAAASLAELGGGHPVLGRMKELVAYWKEQPRWRRLWPVVKLSRTLEEFLQAACKE